MAANNVARVTWSANSETDLAGYRVYYGSTPGVYLGFFNVLKPTTELTIADVFTHDGKWYFAVTAYDLSNNESTFSSEVSKRIIRGPAFLRRRRP